MNKLSFTVSQFGAVSLALACAALPVQSLAQTGVDTPEFRGVIEEVIVLARKREESIQDVPIAVSAVTGDQIDQAFLQDSTSLAQFAPNVVFDTIEAGTPGGGSFSIRGISYQDVEKTFDPTVLVMLDGIAIGTGTANTMNLLDIESVEILRGPQGTLFGKNAVGGIINIRRKKPELDSVHGSARATFGDFDTNDVEGYFNYGASNVAIKLTAARLDHDGYFENLTRGVWEGERTEERVGAALLWQPHDRLSVELKGDYSNTDGSPNPMLNISDRSALDASGDVFCSVFGECAPGEGQAQSGDPTKNLGQRPTELELKLRTIITEVNWDVADDYRLTYLFGWLDDEDYVSLDSDGTPQQIFSVTKPAEYEQRSHELRLTRSDDIFNWQAGLYYWNADSFTFQTIEPPFTEFSRFWGGSESYSIFGEGDFRFAERYVLTAGFRYIEEEKTIEKFVTDGAGNPTIPMGTKGSRTDDDTIWRLGLRYEVNDDVMTYITYSTGFRSGAYSPRASTIETLLTGAGPETLTNYELGMKSRGLDGRLQLNGALFYMEYEDMQLESNIPGGPSGQQQGLFNIGQATLQGLELDFVSLLTDSWSLSGNLGWLDAEYDEFFTDLYGVGEPADFTYLDLRRAPEWSYAIASDYDVELPSGTASFRVAYNWRDDYVATLNDHPGTHVDAFGLLDASLIYRHGAHWSFSLFGRNLTDENAFTHTFAVVPTPEGGSLWKFANPRVPRTYGLEVTYEFGEE